MFNEFKKFILRGNLVDLAVGFTVGAAFSTVAKSLVDDILMPPLGYLLGNANFSDLFWVLLPGNPPGPYNTLVEAQLAGAITINYGNFLNSLLSLLVVAAAMFLAIHLFSRLEKNIDTLGTAIGVKKSKKGELPTQKKCPYCLTKIPYKATRCPACTSKISE